MCRPAAPPTSCETRCPPRGSSASRCATPTPRSGRGAHGACFTRNLWVERGRPRRPPYARLRPLDDARARGCPFAAEALHAGHAVTSSALLALASTSRRRGVRSGFACSRARRASARPRPRWAWRRCGTAPTRRRRSGAPSSRAAGPRPPSSSGTATTSRTRTPRATISSTAAWSSTRGRCRPSRPCRPASAASASRASARRRPAQCALRWPSPRCTGPRTRSPRTRRRRSSSRAPRRTRSCCSRPSRRRSRRRSSRRRASKPRRTRSAARARAAAARDGARAQARARPRRRRRAAAGPCGRPCAAPMTSTRISRSPRADAIGAHATDRLGEKADLQTQAVLARWRQTAAAENLRATPISLDLPLSSRLPDHGWSFFAIRQPRAFVASLSDTVRGASDARPTDQRPAGSPARAPLPRGRGQRAPPDLGARRRPAARVRARLGRARHLDLHGPPLRPRPPGAHASRRARRAAAGSCCPRSSARSAPPCPPSGSSCPSWCPSRPRSTARPAAAAAAAAARARSSPSTCAIAVRSRGSTCGATPTCASRAIRTLATRETLSLVAEASACWLFSDEQAFTLAGDEPAHGSEPGAAATGDASRASPFARGRGQRRAGRLRIDLDATSEGLHIHSRSMSGRRPPTRARSRRACSQGAALRFAAGQRRRAADPARLPRAGKTSVGEDPEAPAWRCGAPGRAGLRLVPGRGRETRAVGDGRALGAGIQSAWRAYLPEPTERPAAAADLVVRARDDARQVVRSRAARREPRRETRGRARRRRVGGTQGAALTKLLRAARRAKGKRPRKDLQSWALTHVCPRVDRDDGARRGSLRRERSLAAPERRRRDRSSSNCCSSAKTTASRTPCAPPVDVDDERAERPP